MTTPKDSPTPEQLKPSPELVAQWSIESGEHEKALEYVCTKAAEWGAQQRGVVVSTQAASDVLAERQRQVEKEGWTPEHDDEHLRGTLSRAAGCYVTTAHLCMEANLKDTTDFGPTLSWPWDVKWWKPTTPRRDLVKAAALILAEIERIDRAAIAAAKEKGE